MSTSSYREILNESAVGHFGPYGGRFVPEALISALDELAAAHSAAQSDPIFQSELKTRHWLSLICPADLRSASLMLGPFGPRWFVHSLASESQFQPNI